MAGFGFNTGRDGHRLVPLTEEESEEVAQGIKEIYRRAGERMLTTTARRFSRGITQPGWAERKASEVLAAHEQLRHDLERAGKERESLLRDVMTRGYLTGSQQFYAQMGAVLGPVQHISPNAMKAGYILADLNNNLNTAERRILRQFDDSYANIIGAVSAEMATGVTNTREAVGNALRAFADQGITSFVDRGGHRWTLENYSEMAVLTAIERSTISGYTDTMQSYGYDLAVIDGHAGACPICAAWEGVIVSVSGDNPDYPSLLDAENDGCFHPRCLHGISTYYPGISHAPEGGFRNEPREIEEPSRQYTARSKQRYMERQIRKYKDRAIVAQTRLQKAQALEFIRRWQQQLDQLIEDQPEDDYLYRHREREKASAEASESSSGLMSTKRETQWPAGDGGTDAAQLKELAQYAESKGIRLDTKSFKRFEGSPKTIRELIDAIGKVVKDFPLLSQQRGGLTIRNAYNMGDADYAETLGQNIIINNNAFRNAKALAADYMRCTDDRLFVKGTTYLSIGLHEAGHAVIHAYQLPYRVTEGIDASEISRYAMETPQEMIAESFSAHYSGADSDASLTLFERCVKLVTERK